MPLTIYHKSAQDFLLGAFILLAMCGLVDLHQHFATKLVLGCFATGHDTFAGADEDDAAALLDLGDVGSSHIDATAWLRHPGQLSKGWALASAVDGDNQCTAWLAILYGSTCQVMILDQLLGHNLLELAGGHTDFCLANHRSVADSGEEIRDWVS